MAKNWSERTPELVSELRRAANFNDDAGHCDMGELLSEAALCIEVWKDRWYEMAKVPK